MTHDDHGDHDDHDRGTDRHLVPSSLAHPVDPGGLISYMMMNMLPSFFFTYSIEKQEYIFLA